MDVAPLAKWLSQVVVLAAAIAGMLMETHIKQPDSHWRKLTWAGWLSLGSLLVGFITFGISDWAERTKQGAAEQERVIKESERDRNLLANIQKLIPGAAALSPARAGPPKVHLVLQQKDKFVPQEGTTASADTGWPSYLNDPVLSIRAGDSVLFRNVQESSGSYIYSLGPTNEFDGVSLGPGKEKRLTFDKPGLTFVEDAIRPRARMLIIVSLAN